MFIMSSPKSTVYIDSQARVIRCNIRLKSFVQASIDYNNDRTNVGKRAKINKMIGELNEMRRVVEENIQQMESAVSSNTAPADIIDNTASQKLIDAFDSLYYELAAFADVHKFSLSPHVDVGTHSFANQSHNINNLSTFQLPKRTFPTFSGIMTEWQGFEDLFNSILSHVPELPDVERFEYLKTSLTGEALSLISHLSLTSPNYHSAWKILRARYGNKRDLARIHIDALLSTISVKSNDASSIKTQINIILEHTAALDNLEFVTRQWSPILIHVMEKHLDYDLRARWELNVGDNHYPQINEFVEFLRSHLRSAEVYSHCVNSSDKYRHNKVSSHNKTSMFKPRSSVFPKVLTTNTNSLTSPNCALCNKSHSIRKCTVFIEKDPQVRFRLAKEHQLCINCLGLGHTSAMCRSKYKCQTCNKSHHTLLHFDSLPSLKPGSSTHIDPLVSSDRPSTNFNTTSLVVRGQPKRAVLLSTMLLNVVAHDGSHQVMRALVDSGSQASFITEKSACSLMLRRSHSSVTISTFNSKNCSLVHGKSTITITQSGHLTPSVCVEVLIVPSITEQTPQQPIMPGKWSHIVNLSLADPLYHTPGEIDILLGADILPSLLLDGKIDGQNGEPMAIETVFGWILMGPVDISATANALSLCLSISEPLDETLKRFWEIEELTSVRHLSPDDTIAENIYRTTTTRLSSGRFMVTIPFRTPRPILGESKSLATQRFKALENRLSRNKELYQQYAEFMNDYLTAGHMELVPISEKENPRHYYIPHHCVLRPESNTTKLRVVFNASSRTSAGTSLNECMYTGPKLQPDIQVVLLRARLWKYVFTADIKQMYRQILVHPDDRDYQRILWRFSPTAPIDEYRLCTVTYGMSAAPYQALRTIRELATVDGPSWPIAASVLLNDTFVDDVLTGANSLNDALECQYQLIQLCSLAKFELRKWASNCSEVLQTIPEEARVMSPSVLLNHSEQTGVKVLGLRWDPVADSFSFKALPSIANPTKRAILSEIARVFDPLGLLSPITFWTKHVMQRLWVAGVAWDDPVPTDIAVAWTRYQSELSFIENISIVRRITHNDSVSLQLHAFSDSSEKGYAAAVYLRIETLTTVYCHLVTGKSKVAPLKKYTIPRLELCGALLAAKLLHFVRTVFTDRLKINAQHAWTDSTTALAWIRSSPHRWATFVANRCSQIQDLTSPSIWRYIPTQQNPVDCASRGLFPCELIDHPLWWTGPSFLRNTDDQWPKSMSSLPDGFDIIASSESKPLPVLLINVDDCVLNLLEKISSFGKILRIIAYCRRLIKRQSSQSSSTGIDADEISQAKIALIFAVQRSVFPEEISLLVKGERCSKYIRSLDPFLDDVGLIRVGGRLRNSDLPYIHKHPVLLPSRHRLTNLIIDYHHRLLQHPGAMALQTHLQREFWILSGRQAIRSRLRLCIPCFRTRPQNVQPKMASLPKYRVQQIKPFSVSGVDYAGPITVKGFRGRSSKSKAAYICLFVCTATKALHLELSSDLSTETFLLAFTRFAARRGPIKELHSDCGTNFVGAANLLSPLQQLLCSTSYQERVREHLSKDQITWHFNPPSSPHFGGLWEAGVKSTKSLISRSIGTHKLTSEELITLLTKIEATLNSRPLCALSNDPKDLEALTPSHFLNLEPSTSLPEPCLENVPLSKMQRWRLISDLHRYFWSRWKNEYLSTLQHRTKWSDTGKSLNVGDLVLIKEPTHPLFWRYGRIVALHPGVDGISRVATIHTTSGDLLRPAVKLCPLPSC